MDHTESTETFFSEKVVTPIVLGLFANDEWDSIALIRDPEDARRLIVRVVVCGEAAEVLLDYPGSAESLFDTQQRLVDELKSFIEGSEFAARRTAEWEADADNADGRPPVVSRTPDPISTVLPTALCADAGSAPGPCASTAVAACRPTAAAEPEAGRPQPPSAPRASIAPRACRGPLRPDRRGSRSRPRPEEHRIPDRDRRPGGRWRSSRPLRRGPIRRGSPTA
jgi:hypothetical protein